MSSSSSSHSAHHLVVKNDKGEFVVNEAAARVLSGIEERIAVIVVSGVYRSGKSFLLNKLAATGRETDKVDQNKVFRVGHSVAACTMGIWFFDRPIPCTFSDGSKGIAILLDSEGLGSTNKSTHYDNQLFMLSTLLASTLVFNSMGTINEKSIQRLTFVGNLIKLLKGNDVNLKKKKSAEKIEMIAPNFVWVLRDFALKLVNTNGKKIDSDEYMEDALKNKSGFDQDTIQRNLTCKQLKSFFVKRKCATLVRPANDESVLQDLSTQPESSLRKEFVIQLDRLRDVLLKGVSPKRAGGVAVNGSSLSLLPSNNNASPPPPSHQPTPHYTGSGLVVLLRNYVDAINSGTIPVLKDAWSAAMNAQLESFANRATRELKASIEKIREENLPMDVATLRSDLEKLKHHTAKSIPGEDSNMTRKKLVKKLLELAETLIEDTMLENVNRSAKECEEKFDRLWNDDKEQEEGEEKKEEDDVIESVWQKYDRVRKKYFEICNGPSLISTFSSRTDRYLRPAMENIVQSSKIEKQDMLGQIEELNRNIVKHQDELKFQSEELGRTRSTIAQVQSEKKEIEANLEVVSESLKSRNEELLNSNLELDKQRALVKSHVEKVENLRNELEEKTSQVLKWKNLEKTTRENLERSEENVRSRSRQLASVQGRLQALRGKCKSVRSKQDDVVTWTRAQIQAEQDMLRDATKRFEALIQRLASRAKSDIENKEKDLEAVRLRLKRQKEDLKVADSKQMDARLELEKTKVLLDDERAESKVMKERFGDAMKRAEKAEALLLRAQEKIERMTKRNNIAFVDDEAEEESKNVVIAKRKNSTIDAKRELRRVNQEILIAKAVSALQAGKSVVKYHSNSSGKANRWIAYNALTKSFGWCNSAYPKPIKDKIRVSDILSVEYGRPSGTFLDRAQDEIPWCCVEVITKNRSYHFVAKNASDAIDVVVALRVLSGKKKQHTSRGSLLWDKIRLRLDHIAKKKKKSRKELLVEALKHG